MTAPTAPAPARFTGEGTATGTGFGVATGNTVHAVQIATATTQRSKEFLRYDSYGAPDAAMTAHFYFWPVITADSVILLDTGFTAAAAGLHQQQISHEVAAALAAVDLIPSDVDTIVCSHLHYDHTGNLGLFPQAEIIVQAAELDHWLSPIAARPLYRGLSEAGDLEQLRRADTEGRLRRVSGDVDLADGVSILALPGHTPGSQGLRVETDQRAVVLASDAIHYYEELRHDWLFALVEDLAASYRTLDRLRMFEAAGDVVVPGHAAEVVDLFETRQTVGNAPVVTLC